ncbi:Ligand-binding domain of nuclear hormone receptor [Ancylostoma ceylanicum]|uniref:Ligand-binding domain of nuclear hormone receptor n=1 Tax=Ancylostoma ceylanicum TaxID=53326 RepID=A0A0D6M9E1_9BILA|nr:Ligand-binding domain of nuclear hormone receptor [Ancylostoma ceylanicum]
MSADAQPNPKQRANVAYPPEPPIGLPARDKATVGALVSVVGPVSSQSASIRASFSASCAGIEPALISTTASPRVMDASASSGGPSRAASPTPVASTADAPSQQLTTITPLHLFSDDDCESTTQKSAVTACPSSSNFWESTQRESRSSTARPLWPKCLPILSLQSLSQVWNETGSRKVVEKLTLDGNVLAAVRMDRKNDKALKRKRSEVDSDEFDENQENIETPAIKKQRTDHRLLTSSLMLIDRTASDGNGKMALSRSFVSLAMVMEEPEILDGDRTEMSFRACAQADEVACAESERRLLTWAIDWTRQVADMEDAISNNDKIALLRACCVPLTLLELGARSCVTAAQSKSSCAALHVLPLPNNTYLRTDAQLPQNWYCSFLSLSFSVTHLLIKFSFLTANSIRGLLEWTTRHLKQLQLSPKELVLLKALIVANVDAPGLSPSAESAVSALRDRVHSALYQHCADVCEPSKAAGRLAKILLLLPQLYLLSTEVVEHQRMRHTFALPYQLNPLLVQLFGDIFEEGKTDEPYLM